MPRRRGTARTVLVLHSTYGGPSRAVAEALVGAFRHREGVRVESVDFLERCMPAMNVLARFAYHQTPAFFRGVTGRIADSRPDDDQGVLFEDLQARGVRSLDELLASVDPVAVVSTCPMGAAAAAEVSAGQRPLSALVVTDHSARFLWLHPDMGLYFVPSRDVRDELVVKGVSYDRIVMTGVPVVERTVPEGGRSVCRSQLGLQDRFTVAVAGQGAISEEGDAIALLVRSGLQVVALVAENSRAEDRARRSAASFPGQVVFVDELHRYGAAMCAADVVVCAAGSPRVPEALVRGLPLVVYGPVPGRECDNVDFLVNMGAALLARDEADIAERCRFLATHPDRLDQLAAASSGLGRPGAADAIVDRVLAGSSC